MIDRILDPEVDRLIASMGEFSPMTKEMQGPEIPEPQPYFTLLRCPKFIKLCTLRAVVMSERTGETQT